MALERDWANLARQVRDRREELGLTQQDVAAAGGPSTAIQRQIENKQATSYRPKTFRTHEKALRLRKDSFRMALAGGRFIPDEDDWPASVDAMLEHLDRTPDLTDADRAALKAHAIALRDSHLA